MDCSGKAINAGSDHDCIESHALKISLSFELYAASRTFNPITCKPHLGNSPRLDRDANFLVVFVATRFNDIVLVVFVATSSTT